MHFTEEGAAVEKRPPLSQDAMIRTSEAFSEHETHHLMALFNRLRSGISIRLKHGIGIDRNGIGIDGNGIGRLFIESKLNKSIQSVEIEVSYSSRRKIPYQRLFSGYYLKRLAYLLNGSVASLPSPSSNIDAWPYGTSLRFAPAFRALGVCEHS